MYRNGLTPACGRLPERVARVSSETTPGERFAQLRKERGFKRAVDLADATGLTRMAIANFEGSRKKDFSIPELVAICKALKVPPQAIFPELAEVIDEGPQQWTILRAKMELMQDFQEFMLTRKNGAA